MYDLYCIPLADELVIGELKREPKAVIVLCDSEAIRYVKERTCQQVDVTKEYQPYATYRTACSLCGETLALEEFPAPNYCPSCGAKVVVEE